MTPIVKPTFDVVIIYVSKVGSVLIHNTQLFPQMYVGHDTSDFPCKDWTGQIRTPTNSNLGYTFSLQDVKEIHGLHDIAKEHTLRGIFFSQVEMH